MKNLLRVNMSTGQSAAEPLPPAYERLAARALSSRIVADEVPATCEPLGPDNKVVFTGGYFAGTSLTSAMRTSVGGKAPLTGTIKESNAGGTLSMKLALHGYRALVIEGEAAEGTLHILHVGADGARLLPADDLRGKGNLELAPLLRERFGDRAGIASIGQAGEQYLSAAAIAHSDGDGRLSRISARGGLAAVMGRKGLKAIVIDDVKGVMPKAVDVGAWRSGQREYTTIVDQSPLTKMYRSVGTSGMVRVMQGNAGLPTRNYRDGQFEEFEGLTAETFVQNITERGGAGNPTHACMPGCIIRCSNIYPDPDGKEIVSPVEFETIGMMGSNLGIGDLDVVAQLNRLCNDFGLDTIEMGVTLGVVMESGMIPFGDGAGAIRLLEEVGKGTVLGRLLGSGALITGKTLGVRRIPHVKGQGLPAYEPRAMKALGVTYATSPMGGDHTAGHTIRFTTEHRDAANAVDVSRRAQIAFTIYDCMGVCIFALPQTRERLDVLAQAISGLMGFEMTPEGLEQIALDTLRVERGFNRAAGFTKEHDRLPEWMVREVLPSTGEAFDVKPAEMDAIFAF
jgi:aldehyde:ferredoxin oxidoreductase